MILFFPRNVYTTVNLFPVGDIRKECYKVQHDSENMIKWKQYFAVLILFNTWQYWSSSLLYVHIMISMAKPLWSRGHTMLLQLQNCTLWYQWGSSGVWNKPLRSPGPTKALIIEASFFCVFVHLDPHFGSKSNSKSQMTITFDCVRLHCFECACELCILCVCVMSSFLCRTKFSRCVKKEKKNKCVRRRLWAWCFFDWHPATGKVFYSF